MPNEAPLQFVFDESGNVGMHDKRDSYAVAGILVPTSELRTLDELDDHLATALGIRDYKYSHFRPSLDARRLLQSGLARAKAQVLAIASLDGGIASEQPRFDAAAGTTSPAYRKRQENLDYFTHYVAHAVHGIAYQRQADVDVWWDRRTDMQVLNDAFTDSAESVAQIDTDPVTTDAPIVKKARLIRSDDRKVRFQGACATSTRPTSRVAGIIASDILELLNRYHVRITSGMTASGAPDSPEGRLRFLGNAEFPCHDFAEPLGKKSLKDTSLPAFRAYSGHLCASRTSFIEPDGRIGHIVRNKGRWFITQTPD